MGLGITTLSIIIFSIKTLGMITFSIITLGIVTASQHNDIRHNDMIMFGN